MFYIKQLNHWPIGTTKFRYQITYTLHTNYRDNLIKNSNNSVSIFFYPAFLLFLFFFKVVNLNRSVSNSVSQKHYANLSISYALIDS